jgi:hypothetical protein
MLEVNGDEGWHGDDIGLGMIIIWSTLYWAQWCKGLGLVQGIEESVCDDLSKMV